MKQKLLNKLWLRVGMIVAIMTTALSGTVWAETITFSELGLENGVQYLDPFDGGDFTVTFAGGSNDGKYYTTGSGIRVYAGGTMTIAAEGTKTLSQIVITYDGSNKPTSNEVVNEGTYNNEIGTWTGEASEVVFTRPSGSGHWRVKSITVTYTTSGGGGGDTPSPTEGTGTINFSNQSGHTAINAASVTGDDDLDNTWTITTVGTTSFTASSTYYQVGSGSKPATSITFTTTLASELNITAMSAKFGGFSGTAGTVTLKVGNTTVGTGSLNGTSDVTVSSTSAAAGTVLTVTVTGIAKGVKCYYISYTYTSSTDPTCETPTFSPAAGTYTSAQNVTISTATEGATIYYTTDGTDPTTSSTPYSGAINVSRTTTIKAIAAAEDHNDSPVASATYTIVSLEHAGTQADPYTVADAFTAIDANAGITGVYVAGIVCTAANSLSNSKYLTYYISDDGTTTNQLEAYHGLGIGGADFTSASDIQKGDKVVIYGNLKKYNSTYEFDADNQLVSIVRPPVISVNSTVDLTCDATSGEIEYEIGNPVVGVSLTATEDADWISNIAVTADKVTFTTTANEGEARTATITLSYTGATDKEVTVTQAAYVAPFDETTWTLASSITSGKHYIITDGNNKAMGAQHDNNRAAVGVDIEDETATVSSADVQEFVIYGPDADGLYTIHDGTGYLYAASSSKNYLRTETTVDNDNNARWAISFGEGGVASVVAQGTNSHKIMKYNSQNDIFSCYASGQQDIYLYEKSGEATPTESKTLNGSGYATYCSQNALDFTGNSDVTAWVITAANSTTGVITFSQIEGKVPAGTGMLLKGTPNGSATMTSSTGATALTNNLLIGTTAKKTVSAGEYYGLSGNTFVPVNAGDVPAGKALLPVTAASGVKAFVFDFEDDATGIEETLSNSPLKGENIYNLAGQMVNGKSVNGKLPKGIYIVNGKKILK